MSRELIPTGILYIFFETPRRCIGGANPFILVQIKMI